MRAGIDERHYADRQACLLALAEALRAQPSPHAMMDAATALLGHHLGVAQVGFGEVDEAQEHVTVHHDWNDGRLASVAGTWRMDDFGPAFIRDMKAGRTAAIPDVTLDPRTSAPPVTAAYRGIGTRAILNVPLVREGRMAAVLFIHHPEPRPWTPDEVSLAEEVGARLWDAVERAHAERALAESEARWRTLAEALPGIVFATGADGLNTYTNVRFQEYSGLSATELLGDGWVRVLHPDDRDRAAAAWGAAVRGGGPYEIEYRFRGADGAYRWFLGRGAPLCDAEGRTTAWFGTCTDIEEIVAAREVVARDRAELERLVEERTAALTDSARELAAEMRRREEAQAALAQSQKLEALGQLTGSVAHDFNNVLAAINGSYGLIRRRTDDPALLDLVARGEQAAERAKKLIRQLLAFARRAELKPELLSLPDVLHGAEDLLRHGAGPGIQHAVEVTGDVWPVLADQQQLEIALLNLAVNARHAMPEGGTLVLGARNLGADELPPGVPLGHYVSVWLRDTGEGMAPEVLARAAEPFFTTKPEGQGTGLGLAMVNGFATQSGGALRITSTPGKGTTVEIVLPRAAGASAEEGASAAAPALSEPPAAGAARLMARLHTPALRDIYLAWCAARAGGGTPRAEVVDPARFGLAGSAFTAAVNADGAAPCFSYVQMGAQLAALRQPPSRCEDVFGPPDPAYRRCARSRTPTYQSARFSGSGVPVRYERLLLPVSADGQEVTHLVGIVLFDGATGTP